METLQYEFNLADQRLRRRRLRQAVLAFISSSREFTPSLHAIGLVVPVPSLSTTPFAVDDNRAKLSAAPSPPSPTAKATPSATKSISARRSARHGTGTAAQNAPPSAKTESRRLRQRQREAAQRTCYGITEARLKQARDDARDVQQWLLMTQRALTGRPLSVLVIASLRPRTLKDLAFCRLWQYGSEAPRASPLRHADLIALTLSSEKLLVAWSAQCSPDDAEGRRVRGKARAAPRRFALEEILLPHQSLLLELGWCVEAGFSRVAVAARSVAPDSAAAPAASAPRRPPPLTPITLTELFVADVLPTLEFPKGGNRSAGWLAYHRWLPLYSEALARERRQDRQIDEDEVAGNPFAVASSGPSQRVLSSVAACCAHMRWLYQAFYGHPRAVGHRQAWRLGTGYGGTVSSLLDAAQHVLVDRPSLSRTHPRSGRARVTAQSGEDPHWCAGLLAVRGQRDVYATLAVLVGQDQMDMYSAAVPVLRAMCRRDFVAGHLLHGAPPLERILTALPTMPTTTAAGGRGTAVSSTRKAAKTARAAKTAVKALASGPRVPAPEKTATMTSATRVRRLITEVAPSVASDGVACDASHGQPAPCSTTTTLSALLRRGRRALLKRRRARRAAVMRSRAALAMEKHHVADGATNAKLLHKRGRPEADAVAFGASSSTQPRKAARAESPSDVRPAVVEQVEATTLESLGWVEDV